MKNTAALLVHGAHPGSIVGSMLRVRLPHVALGELCELRASAAAPHAIGHGVVVAINADIATVSVLGSSDGLSRDIVIVPTGNPLTVAVSQAMLGSVLDGMGNCVERMDQQPHAPASAPARKANTPPPAYLARRPIEAPFCTGVRAIDALLTCGIGQRTGIFAAAGSGKTTLLEMIVDDAEADVVVIALIGERGREVAGFVERVRASGRAARTVIVQATSDTAPATRCSAALLATTVAEYFRDGGKRVLLVVDSITRYARALRDLALASGEPPARRGYPASVFEALPRLLERPGCTEDGSITAFYSVLLEEEEGADPVGEEVKSLLDGHIYLSARLAGRGHFPAIDLLRSASRMFGAVCSGQQQEMARRLRGALGVLEEMQLMRDLGEYRPGANAQFDAAIAQEAAINAFLRQRADQRPDLRQTMEELYALPI